MKRMTAAERSIDTLIYTLMPALPEKRAESRRPLHLRSRGKVDYDIIFASP